MLSVRQAPPTQCTWDAQADGEIAGGLRAFMPGGQTGGCAGGKCIRIEIGAAAALAVLTLPHGGSRTRDHEALGQCSFLEAVDQGGGGAICRRGASTSEEVSLLRLHAVGELGTGNTAPGLSVPA